MKRLILAVPVTLATVAPAFAHLDPAEHGSLAAGLSHPLFGADHVLAMIAVGLFGAAIGRRAVWALPLGFVSAMLAGFALSLSGIELPFVEPVILASVVALGLVVAMAAPVPAVWGVALAAFFALFHGNAHGAEIGLAGIAPYAAGFALATGFLHATGAALGVALTRLAGERAGRMAIRAAGGATVLSGLALAFAA